MRCNRCGYNGTHRQDHCGECGVDLARPVKRKFRTRKNRPGKRGRNSGTTNTAKNK